jgi:hypothetical protein
MKKKHLLLLLPLLLLFVRIPVHKVTFGKAYGECMDSCAIIYSVSKYRITKDVYSSVFDLYEGRRSGKHTFIEEDHDGSFNACKPWVPLLMVLVPEGFTVGCPDCWDQGNILFEIEAFGKKKTYSIDPSKIPFYFYDLEAVISFHERKCEEQLNVFKKQ